MTTRGLDPPALAPATPAPVGIDWIDALSTPGPRQDAAMRELHSLMLRAARQQVLRMPSMLGGLGREVVEDIVNQAADEAMMTLLGKLGTFEGRSRFTTWAYKFAVLQAASDLRKRAWRDRVVDLDAVDVVSSRPGPEHYAEAADLAAAVREALATVLSPHQRRILVALVVDEVPIDVLADRLGASRNALYKTLHDARKRLRAHLRATGHIADVERQQG